MEFFDLLPEEKNAARADPNSCSLFTHNYAEEGNNENEERGKRIKSHQMKKTRLNQFFLMAKKMKRETKSSVSAFSY